MGLLGVCSVERECGEKGVLYDALVGTSKEFETAESRITCCYYK